jgi:sugar lactone lactonase YvrE
MNQLNQPIDVILDKEKNNLIICDYENRRVVRWSLQNSTRGETIISDIDCEGLTIDSDGYLYVCNRLEHEVRGWKIGKNNGTLVAGGNGNNLNQFDQPTFILIDEDHSIYVSDCFNYRAVK